MSNLIVKVRRKVTNGTESWEGTASLPGVQPTKITKSKGSEVSFSTLASLTSAAKKVAVRYNFTDVQMDEGKKLSGKSKKKATAKA